MMVIQKYKFFSKLQNLIYEELPIWQVALAKLQNEGEN